MTLHPADQIRMEEYDYSLPDGRIARYPLASRDASKLLVFREGRISHDRFGNIGDHLEKGNLLVYNDTRVIQARLEFFKPGGSRIEIFCLEPFEPHDYQQNFASTDRCTWKCLVGNAKKWKEGPLQMIIGTDGLILEARKAGILEGSFAIRFRWTPGELSFGEVLEQAGKTPIPPYLERDSEPCDRDRYQTVYSLFDGSVAAPTAGLHFTGEVLDRLSEKDILTTGLTLHVGAGTFRPVQASHLSGHEMHAEFFSITRESIGKMLDHAGKIVAVGTTSLRCLESLYIIARKLRTGEQAHTPFFNVGQWDALHMTDDKDPVTILAGLLEIMERKNWQAIEGSTRLMIIPGHRFRLVNALVTNFHMPRSTLLLLVAALTGKAWKDIYTYAMENDFRFLSYGDSSLLYPG